MGLEGISVTCFAETYFQKPFSLGGEKEPDVQIGANPCAGTAVWLCVSRHAPRAASRAPCGWCSLSTRAARSPFWQEQDFYIKVAKIV